MSRRNLASWRVSVVASIFVLIVAGIVWRGDSIPIFQRIWYDLMEPPDEPMRFRFILQPLMAATARIILLGLVMEMIYQGIVLKQFYPAEAVIVALLFAFVPYVFMCGPALRIARRWVAAAPHQTA